MSTHNCALYIIYYNIYPGSDIYGDALTNEYAADEWP